jgi:hypothetical protein
MFRRTRATNLYQNGVELELISTILGHASTQTTRIYATPSMKMLKEAMGTTTEGIPEEEPLWCYTPIILTQKKTKIMTIAKVKKRGYASMAHRHILSAAELVVSNLVGIFATNVKGLKLR